MTVAKTKWYPPSIKPVRPGAYETATAAELKGPGNYLYSNWTGRCFSYACSEATSAVLYDEESIFNGLLFWRGLVEAPK